MANLLTQRIETSKKCVFITMALVIVCFVANAGVLWGIGDAPIEKCGEKSTQDAVDEVFSSKLESMLPLIILSVITSICTMIGCYFFTLGPKSSGLSILMTIGLILVSGATMLAVMVIKASDGTLCRGENEDTVKMAFRISGTLTSIQINVIAVIWLLIFFCANWIKNEKQLPFEA